MIIYGLYDSSIPDFIRYVGKTKWSVEDRLALHLKEARIRKKRNHRLDWITSVIRAGHHILADVIATANSENELNQLERCFIAAFRAIGIPLVNSTDGGDGVIGHKHDIETRLRIGNAGKGRRHSEESRRKIGIVHKGKPLTMEHRRKLTEAKIGRPLSAKHRQKIGDGNRGNKRTFSVEHRYRLSEAMRNNPERLAKMHSASIQRKRELKLAVLSKMPLLPM